jgi:hypothetical protein
MFDSQPPTLEQYLPVDEILMEAPHVTDAELGTVYNFNCNQN